MREKTEFFDAKDPIYSFKEKYSVFLALESMLGVKDPAWI